MAAQTFDTVPHVILSAHGALATSEQWSCGLRTTLIAAGLGQSSLQTLADAAAAAWKAFLGTGDNGFASSTSLTGVTARSLDSRGVTTTQAEGLPVSASTGVSTQILPNQIATVVTLKTARAGRTGKGRVYLPTLALDLQGDGIIRAVMQGHIATEFKALVDAINTALGALPTAPRVAVQSKLASSQNPGTYTGAAVTSVGVGNVPDTQRRRRNSLVEAYVSAAIA